jgi:hypothetical protein
MQIKFSIALVMIVINSTFYSDITVAKEKMIFAGVTIT